mgnify:CR=1 FL=1
MASRILGMGDMLSFIEKAEQQYDEQQAKKLEEKLRKNRLTLSDYLDQLEQLQNMGDLSQIASMLPGNMAKGFDPDQIDPKQFARTKAIIQSMTLQERENPQILNASRKKRIAAGWQAGHGRTERPDGRRQQHEGLRPQEETEISAPAFMIHDKQIIYFGGKNHG